mgnify:CR=1 FL=1
MYGFLNGLLQANPVSEVQLNRQVQRATAQAAQRANANLLDAVNDLQTPEKRYRMLLNQGADPCHALPFAVFSNNARAVRVLAEYKDKCNWKYAVEQRLPLVMQKDRVAVFHALMADNQDITCPDPFAFTPAQAGSRWHAVSREMLAAVNQRCFRTPAARSDFLRNVILLQPGHRTAFMLGESYFFGIHSAKDQQRWLESIGQLLSTHSKISDETLLDVISQSRVASPEGVWSVPFSTVRQLVTLCLQGGANGPAVLKRLDSPAGEWAWEHYSAEERMRLSNLLEHKPEKKSRSFSDRIRHAYQRIF